MALEERVEPYKGWSLMPSMTGPTVHGENLDYAHLFLMGEQLLKMCDGKLERTDQNILRYLTDERYPKPVLEEEEVWPEEPEDPVRPVFSRDAGVKTVRIDGLEFFSEDGWSASQFEDNLSICRWTDKREDSDGNG